MSQVLPARLTFRQELADFLRFLRHPDVRRLPGRRAGGSLRSDWWPDIRPGRLLAWAASLWFINLVLFGQLAVYVADRLGASHRLDPEHVPVLMAVLWAPLVEEMLFRYSMRHPGLAWWLCPVSVVLVMHPMRLWSWALLACVLAAACVLLRRGLLARGHWASAWRREYARVYGVVYHGVALLFAAVHLHNFLFGNTTIWLLPVLVLPQWATGLVLGWMRTRRGIGASIALHALFNAGPVAVIVLVLHFVPGSA